MEKVAPPFKVDVAGTFPLPPASREARGQYRNEQISLLTLRAVEDVEIRNLADRLKAEGLKVVIDGCFRSDVWPLDPMCGLDGIRFRDDRKTSVELTGRIDVHRHPVLDDFVFLAGVTGGDVIAKQVPLAPSRLLTELMRDANWTQLDLIYPELETLLVDIVQVHQKLIMELYKSECHYLQLDDATRMVTDNAIRVSNMALENLPAGLYVAFHSPTEMLFLPQGINVFFLDYDSECCGKNRLPWFMREKQPVFGFVLSHYPVEEELEELRAKVDQVVRYIPPYRLSLCIPNAEVLPSESYEEAEEEQWYTLRMAEMAAGELWPEEEQNFFITIVHSRGTDS